VATVAYESVK